MGEIEAWWIKKESWSMEYIESREELIRAFFARVDDIFELEKLGWPSLFPRLFFLMFDYKCVFGAGIFFFFLASVFLRDPTRTRAL